MDRRTARGALAAALVIALVGSGMTSAASARPARCNPKKTTCPTTTTTSTTSSTTSTSTTSTTVAPDTTAPSAHIATPTDGSDVAGTITASGSSSDDRTVARVEVRVDSGSWKTVSGTESWSAAIDTSAWAAGSAHSLAARAVDGAGNISSVETVTVYAAPADDPAGDPSIAPATQGTWVSPEGVTIDVATAGGWTIRDIYRMLLESATRPGDFATIAPTLTVKVQDTTASQTTTSALKQDGVYVRFRANLYLKGVSSAFASKPDFILAHEYGHVWTLYHSTMSRNGDWSSYLDFRWANADGSVRLADDARLGSSYTWDRAEIIADDYRLLFGSAAAVEQGPAHLNSYIPAPSAVPGLATFFETAWAG